MIHLDKDAFGDLVHAVADQYCPNSTKRKRNRSLERKRAIRSAAGGPFDRNPGTVGFLPDGRVTKRRECVAGGREKGPIARDLQDRVISIFGARFHAATRSRITSGRELSRGWVKGSVTSLCRSLKASQSSSGHVCVRAGGNLR